MTKIITFGNTILEGSGKKGILKPMDPGGAYYLVNAGGFNIPNRAGIVYGFNDYLKECMREDSDLNRRVSEGQVQCELGHPPQYFWENVGGRIVQTPITDIYQWIHRLRTVMEPNVCGAIRKIHWVMTGGDKDPIYNQIEVRPFGVHGHIMQASLEDPDMNTAFSIRTVTKPQKMGERNREVDYFSTYDMVIEQGMLHACKHRTAGLEDFMSSALVDSTPAEVSTTVDEFFFLCDKHMGSDAAMARFAGNESFDRVKAMVNDLKKRYTQDKPIKLVRSSSLSVFM
jgi:hypothetical protein